MGIVYFDDADRFMAGENKRDEIGGVGKEFGKNRVNEKESGKTGKGEKTFEKNLPATTLIFDDLAAVAAELINN